MKEILKKLADIEEKQDKILGLLNAKTVNSMTKLEAAEIFFRNCRLDKISTSKAPDLLYPSIYSTRKHAVEAIKTLKKKGLLISVNNTLVISKR